VRADGAGRGGEACDIGAFEYDSNENTLAITLGTFTASRLSTPGITGVFGAAIAALSAAWGFSSRIPKKKRLP
jgi:hypothetical protein